MTEHTALARVAIVLLFAITFTFMGWTVPVLYATYAPDHMVVQTHNFAAEDTVSQADEHFICWDRTVHSPSSGKIFTELYIVNEDNVRREISADTMDRYFQQGRQEVIIPIDLPNDLEPGKYRYLLVVRMDLAGDRVVRDFTYESTPFTVTDEPPNPQPPSEMEC